MWKSLCLFTLTVFTVSHAAILCVVFPIIPLTIVACFLGSLLAVREVLKVAVTTLVSNSQLLAGVTLLIIVGYPTCRLLVSFLTRKLVERKWRNKVEKIPVKEFHYVTAGDMKLDFGANCIYLPIYHGEQELRLPLSLEMIGGLNALFRQAPLPREEMTLQRSVYHECATLPKGVVMIFDGDVLQGMGSRVSVGSRSYLVTARHVVSNCVNDVFIGRGGVRIPIDKESVQILPISGVDVSVVEIPAPIWSVLGVAALKSRTAVVGSVVQLWGEVGGKLAFSTGQIQKFDKIIGTHAASTQSGWSGTPLFNEGHVVGVHIGNDGVKANEFVRIHEILDVLGRAFQESPTGAYGAKAIAYDEFVENVDEQDRVSIRIGGVNVLFSDHNYAAKDILDMEKKFVRKSWYQLSLEGDDMDYYTEYPECKSTEPETVSGSVTAAADEAVPLNGVSGRQNAQVQSSAVKATSLVCSTSATTSCPKEEQLETACPSVPVDALQSRLEVLNKEVTQVLSELKKSSQNSLNGAGPKSARKPRKRASRTKHLDSNEPSAQATGEILSGKSGVYIPPHKQQALVFFGPLKQDGKL
jgi:hypothetical protein